MESEILNPEKQERAKQLARIERRIMLGELLFGFTYLVAWLITGWSISLREFLDSLGIADWLEVLVFAAVFGGILVLINIPVQYYQGYILPHRFGLSNQDLKSWWIDQVKGFLLGVVLGVFILEVMYALLRQTPDTWWLWLGIIMLVFNVLLANLAPILLLPIFYKFKPLSEEHEDLVERLLRLTQKASTHVQGVYQFDMSTKTNTANAALTGLGKTRRIILSDTLLDQFSDDEIETVLAHELAHHVYRDIPVGILISSLLTLGGLYLASVVMDWGVSVLGFEGVADVAAMPLLVLSLGLFSFATIPVENYYSRWREKRADLFALQVTRNGEAYASALTRLANQNLSEIDPEPWWEILFYSHPSLGKRIKMAMTYGGE